MLAGVIDNPAAARYEMQVPQGLAFVAYRRAGDVLSLDHAEVPAATRGTGLAARFLSAVLDDIRQRGLKVVPRCSYVASFIRRHPAYQDIVV